MTFRSARFIAFIALLLGFLSPQVANAIPAFARQTGMPCASCHVGSFGPQLTKMGRLFKANGYTMGEKQAFWKGISAMVAGGNEQTAKAVVSPDVGKPNNNTTIDQVSLFYGGRVTDHIGIMTQATYDPNGKALALDNTDIRYANMTTLAGQSLIYGVSVNNNPSMQDLWQTTPAWGYPYLASALAPAPDADSFMAGQGGQVVGAGAYGLWNDLVYAEYSRYYTLSDGLQQSFGNGNVSGNDHLDGGASYWRFALQHDFGPHYLAIGTYGFGARRYPGNDRSAGADQFRDAAIDGTWQVSSADGKHSLSAYVSMLHEHQSLRATYALGASANPTNTMDSFKANVSYYYDNMYGLTIGRFDIRGSADALLYGSPNGKPDSSGYISQVDFTPFGKIGDIGYPYANIRVFVQYTAYDKFNGQSQNYDGTGRKASDNNTVFTGLWFAY
ncbi:hypothetical protein [Asticcacaulis sp. EMRT-3]|uniref:hypothetical protein n=1 Tax=Asticcacaulis sp. EMRT-3 TaxID=3040349 RepID=UPI0024AF5DA7|nr:hypothetical protein [Asticcacaulis sp. EMRT-3]MDI7776267.1 hypothetical protein [Asticcacaulis sp. EMRT-3]